MSKKDKGRLAAFIPVLRDTMRTPAWLAMSKGARWLFVAIKGRYSSNFHNNGKLYVSSRKAAEEIGADQKEVLRWFRELQHYGFIVKTADAFLGVDGKGKAPHWRITELGMIAKDGTLVPPTRDYLKWNGVKFKADGEIPSTSKTESRGGNPHHSAGEIPLTPDGEIPLSLSPKCRGKPLHIASGSDGEIPLISSLTTGVGGAGLIVEGSAIDVLSDASKLKAA
jgi:hypothetical protein